MSDAMMALSELLASIQARPDAVIAKRRIEQNPLSDAPAVPRGTKGDVADWVDCDEVLFVDFGGEFGVVCCDARDVRGL